MLICNNTEQPNLVLLSNYQLSTVFLQTRKKIRVYSVTFIVTRAQLGGFYRQRDTPVLVSYIDILHGSSNAG